MFLGNASSEKSLGICLFAFPANYHPTQESKLDFECGGARSSRQGNVAEKGGQYEGTEFYGMSRQAKNLIRSKCGPPLKTIHFTRLRGDPSSQGSARRHACDLLRKKLKNLT